MRTDLLEVAEKALAGEPGALEFLIYLVVLADTQGESIENLPVMLALAQGLAKTRPPVGGVNSRKRDDNQSIAAQVIEIGDKLIDEHYRAQWLEHKAAPLYASTIVELENRGLLRRSVELYLDELLNTPDKALNTRERELKEGMALPEYDDGWKHRSQWVDSVVQIIQRRSRNL